VGFTTNGVELDAGNRRALLESGVEVLGVSLAGATAETHDHFRGGNPLATVDRNLRALREEKEGRGAGLPRLHLAYQLLVSNLAELPAVLDLARTWGAAQVVVSNLDLVLTQALEEESLACRPDLREDVEECLVDVRSRASEVGIGFHAYRHATGEPGPTCTENVLKSCFVTADGDVSPCVMANVGIEEDGAAIHRFKGKDVALPSLVFGNVHEKPLEKIWRADEARAFRRVFQHRIWTGRRSAVGLPSVCRSCNKLYEA
jgi:MoaA/NifB/PqqE/SkfB family radical SAM enzyme